MSRVFIDTSAILALLVASDKAHLSAKEAFAKLAARQAPLLTTSYVLVETYALLGRRIGLAAVKSFRDDFAPLIDIIWVNKDLHERALDLLLQRSTETLSLVDVTSFIVMQEHKIDEAFSYDRDFGKEGFTLVRS